MQLDVAGLWKLDPREPLRRYTIADSHRLDFDYVADVLREGQSSIYLEPFRI